MMIGMKEAPTDPRQPRGYRLLILALTMGLLIGILGVLCIRFATYRPEHTHYHANFAVYLNGKRDEFKGSQYYQSVAICSAGRGITIPEQRAHMHDNINSVIHIHDHATTWGQFFENLGWSIGSDYIHIDDGTQYTESADAKLHVIINGQDYTNLMSIANTVIKDKDRLLVSFGAPDEVALKQEYLSVPSTAGRYDASIDPQSCSGMDAVTLSDRLHHLF